MILACSGVGLAKVAIASMVIMDKLLWWWTGLVASCLVLLCASAVVLMEQKELYAARSVKQHGRQLCSEVLHCPCEGTL